MKQVSTEVNNNMRINPHMSDIKEGQEKARLIMAWGGKVLALSSSTNSLNEIITTVITACEAILDHSICSVFSVDEYGDYINDIIAPNLPKSFAKAVMGEGIGPMAGSCGTAVYRKVRTITQDIATDPLWVVHRNVALINDIKSSWSTPVLLDGNVWGVLNVYRRGLGRPDQLEEEVVDYFVGLLSHAIRLKSDQKKGELNTSPLSDELPLSGKDMIRKKGVANAKIRLEQRYMHVLNAMKDGFVLVDQKGQVIATNSAYEKMIGYHESEILKMNIVNLRYGLTYKEFVKRIPEVIKKGSVQRISQHRHKSGKLIDVEVSCSVINIDGQVFVVTFIRDITDKKLKEELMKRQFQALEKYAFINSHEVRARVATMLGLINLHKGSYLTEEERSELYGHLYNEATGLDQITRNLTHLINDHAQVIE